MNTVTKYTQGSVFCHTCHEWILPEYGIDENYGVTRCTKCGKVSFEAAVLRERRVRETAFAMYKTALTTEKGLLSDGKHRLEKQP